MAFITSNFYQILIGVLALIGAVIGLSTVTGAVVVRR